MTLFNFGCLAYSPPTWFNNLNCWSCRFLMIIWFLVVLVICVVGYLVSSCSGYLCFWLFGFLVFGVFKK